MFFGVFVLGGRGAIATCCGAIVAFMKDKVQLQLRLPGDLHATIVASARDAGRSLNAEVVERLRVSLGLGEGDVAVAAEASVGSRSGRRGLCVHRLRPDQFCARCDG